ncbi:DUF2080 family transposase-associated protein [Candidatus Woesearchaeota archaeon]|nr:DUF2080 family transposase-associated protein [Candidatus Woesearchaeota archaeon]
MNKKPQKADITLVFEQLKANMFLEKKVGKNNSTSGKISLPKDMIGKKVYVVWQAK